MLTAAYDLFCRLEHCTTMVGTMFSVCGVCVYVCDCVQCVCVCVCVVCMKALSAFIACANAAGHVVSIIRPY